MHPGYFILIGVVLIVILSAVWQSNIRKRRKKILHDFAEKYGFEITNNVGGGDPKFRIAGTLDGYEFEYDENRISGHRRASEENKTYWTLIKFHNTPVEVDFELYCDSWAMQMTKHFGFVDVEVGDEAFDKKFFCHSKEPEKMKTLMQDKAQQKILLGLHEELYGRFDLKNKVEDNLFQFSYYGCIKSPTELQQMDNVIEFMRAFIKKFES